MLMVAGITITLKIKAPLCASTASDVFHRDVNSDDRLGCGNVAAFLNQSQGIS